MVDCFHNLCQKKNKTTSTKIKNREDETRMTKMQLILSDTIDIEFLPVIDIGKEAT